MLQGADVTTSQRTLKEIVSIYERPEAVAPEDLEQIAYKVMAHLPVKEGTAGGLFFGTSILMPGKVGDEYFMTKGHFHSNIDTAEYYWCISGTGALILMDEEGNCQAKEMSPGALHYIPGRVAHRLANTGSCELVVGACWPSDAGHDYATIEKNGFSARLVDVDGVPTLKRV
ncbi:MAG: cupin domain-containing protein [Vallitaleaceae bacterium]|nr:cupin domain-containing protein [Vallitaleaceae bacterium]